MQAISSPTELDLLVVFFDLTGYGKYASTVDARRLFDRMAALFARIEEAVEMSGGTVIKFIGDAGLIVYPADQVDRGIQGLTALQADADRWLEAHGMPCRIRFKAHFGPVVAGPVGGRLDVYGETVNRAATLPSFGFSMTAEAFRRLSASMRQGFKKHTPPVRYIPMDEKHRD